MFTLQMYCGQVLEPVYLFSVVLFQLECPKTDVNTRSIGGLVLSITPSVFVSAYINYTSHYKGLLLHTDIRTLTSHKQTHSGLIGGFL